MGLKPPKLFIFSLQNLLYRVLKTLLKNTFKCGLYTKSPAPTILIK
jgi:hypothetical protein